MLFCGWVDGAVNPQTVSMVSVVGAGRALTQRMAQGEEEISAAASDAWADAGVIGAGSSD